MTANKLTCQDGFAQIRETIKTAPRARQFYELAREACVKSGYITAEKMDTFGKSRDFLHWQEWCLFALSQIGVAYGSKWTNRGTTEEEHSNGWVAFAGYGDTHTDLTKADQVVSDILEILNS